MIDKLLYFATGCACALGIVGVLQLRLYPTSAEVALELQKRDQVINAQAQALQAHEMAIQQIVMVAQQAGIVPKPKVEAEKK